MTSRWDVERELRSSTLRALDKLIVLMLATWSDARTGATPASHTPSLTDLACACSLDRTTVARHLSRLERDGWVIRRRPPVEASRRGAKTRYQLVAPVQLGNGGSATRGSGAGATDLVAPAPHRSDLEPTSDHSDTTSITEQIARLHEWPANHARRVVDDVLSRANGVRDPLAYVKAAIDKEPHRYRYDPGPPRFQGGRFTEGDAV